MRRLQEKRIPAQFDYAGLPQLRTEAREKLARTGEDQAAPNRNPPPVEDEITAAAEKPPLEAPADAAE